MYETCTFSILLYGSRSWISLRNHRKRLNGFHHMCIRMVLDIYSEPQWREHISSLRTREEWGGIETVTIQWSWSTGYMQWLGYIVRMKDHWILKIVFFDQFGHCRPSGGLDGDRKIFWEMWRLWRYLKAHSTMKHLPKIRGMRPIPSDSTKIYQQQCHSCSVWCTMWCL